VLGSVKVKSLKSLVPCARTIKLFGALCPSKSGLMNKHIVKHIVNEHIVNIPSKSGLLNEHIVNIVGLTNKHIVV